MRFDSIDLFGDFKIGGLTGGPGQVLGVTQGQIGWITVASSGGGGGGGVGAQGPTGPSILIPCENSPFVGCGNSIAGENFLFFDFDKKNFRSGNGNFCMTASNSAILSSSNNVYIDGAHNVALSSADVCIIGNNSGQKDCLTSIISSKYGGIVDGDDITCLSSIISSKGVYLGDSFSSVIVSSACHTNGINDVVRRSAFISSKCSCLINVDTTIISGYCAYGNITNSSFIMGKNVCIECSDNSVIMASGDSCITCSDSSVIIGSKYSWIDRSHNTVILGGRGLTASNCLNTTIVQRLQCLSKINFCTTVEPVNLEDGMIWLRNNKLWVRLNGQTGTFSLVT